jgi:hypothetical protein
MYEALLEDFYLLIDRLSVGLDGGRTLSSISRNQGWPRRGVYFFFEPGEMRPTAPHQPRVVRVGTHGLKAGAKSTLYGRLRQHRGLNDGGGNHRGSVFRKHAGRALLAKSSADQTCPSWGRGNHATHTVTAAERWLECEVSRYLGSMSVIWLDIDDEPGPLSSRGFIERNAIGLLACREAASPTWLGRHTTHPTIPTSYLWNVDHIQHPVEDDFIHPLSEFVDVTIERRSLPE